MGVLVCEEKEEEGEGEKVEEYAEYKRSLYTDHIPSSSSNTMSLSNSVPVCTSSPLV